MAQPIKNEIKPIIKKVKSSTKKSSVGKKKRHHKEYGTSKLEEKFAKEFLEKIGVEYVYQYKAESIGRYYDFYIPSCNVLIEVDGTFYHSYGLVYEEMSPMQKRNYRVDKQKDQWALERGILLLRIWEHDINKNPEKVRKLLKERIGEGERLKKIKDDKKKRH